ncbi:hypothetical protein JET18_13420 [Chryseobacterium sp. L7]|uniref:DoxX family protein n=1 Tax=Chryseobacterium endalhagicum TaxID=2797638 RepID=A0ABS1QHQ8_9FLAO|nr:hypothetical protein [Chryseobacterium endalhagicum]MBL1221846.1 hypothetical protein [Chryseobacterium endalhagicum]
MRSRLAAGVGMFFLLFMLFFPLDFLGDFQKEISSFLFGDLTGWIVKQVFQADHARIDFSSDSLSMLVLVILLLIISVFITALIKEKHLPKLLYFSKEIAVLYIAVVLLKYGLDKIFKAQFYLPEPNILYSRFGNLDKDILFWSTMGTSRLYSISMGVFELLAALLILFRITRTLGLLISVGIVINILFINLGFDISVKFFSLILLCMAVFGLKDEWIPLYRFLILKQKIQLQENTEPSVKLLPVWIFFKTAFVGTSLVMILFPYINSGNYNDDLSERPLLHGAFKNADKNSDLQYIFFHRNHYVILMDKDEKTRDFHYSSGSKDHLILEDYGGRKTNVRFSYQKKDSLLTLRFGTSVIVAREENWRKMNALRPLFHSTIENSE